MMGWFPWTIRRTVRQSKQDVASFVGLPVTSAACGRSFSALKLIKTYLRNSMCDGRPRNLAVLSVESTRAKATDFDAFVDEFDSRHQNRKLALH
jgi:hAT family C-terminal dimerisation region